MNAHIAKPIDPNELLNVLEQWIKPGERNEPLLENPTDNQTSLPDNLPGVDLVGAIRRLGGNRSLLAKLLLRFAGDYAETAATLDDMLRDGNLSAAIDLVHRLAGVAANLGASDLATTAKNLEKQLREGRDISLQASFTNKLATVTEAINNRIRLADQQTPQQGICNPAEAVNVLEQLAGKLSEYEAMPPAVLSSLYAGLETHIPQSQLLKLADQIERYDYPNALANIESMLLQLQEKQNG